MWRQAKKSLRRYLLAGFLTLVPIGATFSLLSFLINYCDELYKVSGNNFFFFIPARFHPNEILGRHIPGMGLLITVLLVILTGAFARNFLGKRLIRWSESLVDKIPLVRSVYSAVKQLMESVIRPEAQGGFKRVVAVPFPTQGFWSIGFVTGMASDWAPYVDSTKKLISVFVPTSPNPTTGFYLMTPEEDIKDLQISVEDAFKVIVSGGIISPGTAIQLPPGAKDHP